jgi:hypothetical protein
MLGAGLNYSTLYRSQGNRTPGFWSPGLALLGRTTGPHPNRFSYTDMVDYIINEIHM